MSHNSSQKNKTRQNSSMLVETEKGELPGEIALLGPNILQKSEDETSEEPEAIMNIEVGSLGNANNTGVSHSNTPPQQVYITGARLYLLLFGLSMAIFLANLEVSIVSTSLVSITNDLNGFSLTGWVVVAYLITYTGFIIIWAKLSDILGRKVSVTSALLIFVVFSGACGASQTMTQLSIFRSFQGIGAAGCFSVPMIVFFEMLPKEKHAKFGSVLSADVALATLLGPLFGGLITDNTTWRWVFLINVPAGGIAIFLLYTLIPPNFPNHGQPGVVPRTIKTIFSKESMRKVDILGAFLLIGGNLLLSTALLESSTTYSWSSAITISLLVLSVVFWVAFLAWEWYISRDSIQQEPIFPWRFFLNRAWMGMLMQSFLLGVPFTVLVIQIPQRFQTLNGLSPLAAGVRLLPYAMLAPIGSLISNIIYSKKQVPIPILFAGATFQVVGLSLLAALPVRIKVPSALYGYEAIAGIGLGITFGTLVVLTPGAVERRDLGAATGAVIQFRQMGGILGLTIGTSVMNGYLKSHLSPILTAAQLKELLEASASLKVFPSELQYAVRHIYATGYSMQMKIVVGFAAAQFPAILMIWRRKGKKSS